MHQNNSFLYFIHKTEKCYFQCPILGKRDSNNLANLVLRVREMYGNVWV